MPDTQNATGYKMVENCKVNYLSDNLSEQNIYNGWKKIPNNWKLYRLDNCLLLYESKLPLRIMIHNNNIFKNYFEKINKFVYWFKYKFEEYLIKYNNENKIIEKHTKFDDDDGRWYNGLIIINVVTKITNRGKIFSEITIIDDNWAFETYSYLVTVEENKITSLKKYSNATETHGVKHPKRSKGNS